MTAPRLIVALPDHPHPTDMGSRVRNRAIIETLAASFDLTIITLVHDAAQLADPGPVARLGRWVPVLAEHRRGFLQRASWHLRARLAASREGLHPETFFQSLPAFSRAVAQCVRAERPALVHAAYWYSLRRLPAFPRPPLWVVDTHDVQFERHARLWGRHSAREQAAELHELARYDRVVAITGRDRDTLGAHLPAGAPPIEVIGMGLDFAHWNRAAVEPALRPAPRVVFYGNLSNEANRTAARGFLRDFLPSWKGRVPDIEALLLGTDPGSELRREAQTAGAVITGFVEDPRPWLASARVFALTLRTGSGQRGRVVEALALGVPVVGYAEALEGLDFAEGEGIVTVRTAEEMAARTLELLADEERARKLGAAGRAVAAERYGLPATYGKFPVLYHRLLEERRIASEA
jgi:glycosyltransferase involved in cell wall biosynthesis